MGYKVDILIPDNLWEKIKLGSGFLSGRCIMKKSENLDEYTVFNITKEKDIEKFST